MFKAKHLELNSSPGQENQIKIKMTLPCQQPLNICSSSSRVGPWNWLVCFFCVLPLVFVFLSGLVINATLVCRKCLKLTCLPSCSLAIKKSENMKGEGNRWKSKIL